MRKVFLPKGIIKIRYKVSNKTKQKQNKKKKQINFLIIQSEEMALCVQLTFTELHTSGNGI
jgi:hypothetical protein